MEEAPENGRESSHSAHANGMNEFCLHMQSRSGWGVDHIGSERDGEEVTYTLEGGWELQDGGLYE